MKKKLVSVLLCATMIATMVAGCGSSGGTQKDDSSSKTKTEDTKKSDDTTTASSDTEFGKALAQVDKDLAPLPKKDSGMKLAAIESTLSNSFWVTMQEGYEDAAKDYGVSIDVQATDSDTDTSGQLDILNNMLVKDYNAIAVSPLTEDCLISGITAANKDDVKIITTGNQVNEDMLKQAGMDVVDVKQCDFDAQKAYDATTAIIEANPDLVGIACGNDDMALGVVRALQEKNMKDKVKVVGVDFTTEAKSSIEEGTYDATVAMSPYLMGREAVIIMLKALEGQDVSEVGDSTPMVLVDKSNVSEMSDWK